jgi:hypothetical protein
MTRFWTGESDDPLDWGRYAAALRSAIRGQRGQRLLRDLVAGLDSLPEPELSSGALADPKTGCVCALGAVALQRGYSLDQLLEEDPDDCFPEEIARRTDFDISTTLANEIMQINDDVFTTSNLPEDRQRRWRLVREWALSRLKETGQ